jgi:isopentenyldiphosphate isomerase
MPEELIEVVNENNGEKTGQALPRAEVLSKQLWCRTTNIYILNRKGEILCHQRSLNKERYPGAWSTHFGGHLSQGEDYESNALKEVSEELGVHIPFIKLVPWRTTKNDKARIWVREYMTVFDGDISKLSVQQSEVEQLKWCSIEQIMNERMQNTVLWMAGTHDIRAEYQCLRAVLTTCLSLGVFDQSYQELHKWNPPMIPATI